VVERRFQDRCEVWCQRYVSLELHWRALLNMAWVMSST